MKKLNLEKIVQLEGGAPNVGCVVGAISLGFAWAGFAMATGGIGLFVAGGALLTTSIGTGISCSTS